MPPFSRLASTGLDFPWGARLENLLLIFLSWPTQGCPSCGELRRGSCTPLFHSWPQLIETHPGEIGCRSCVPSSMVGLSQVSHTLGCQTMDTVPHLPWLTCTSSSINGQPSLCKSMEAEPPLLYCPPVVGQARNLWLSTMASLPRTRQLGRPRLGNLLFSQGLPQG